MTRSGSYIFQSNKDGYESFKNIGFEILTTKNLRNEILSLFEVSYRKYERVVEATNAMWGNIPFWWKDYFISDRKLSMIPMEYDKLHEETDDLNIVKTLLERRISQLQD